MADAPIYAEVWERQYLKLMFRVIRNERVDFLRANGDYLENEMAFSNFGGDFSEFIADNAANGFALVDSGFQSALYSMAVTNALLYNALERLNDAQRNVAIMAFGFGLSCRDISDETGIAVHTVKRLRRKTLKRLQEFIRED